jgi:hypothetical protein
LSMTELKSQDCIRLVIRKKWDIQRYK